MASQDTLLIRHLPTELRHEDKKDLLYHFGAVRVKVMGGSMKNCAFATFSDEEEAKKAILRLHQLKIFDQNLVAEYAKVSQQEHFPKYIDDERKILKEDKSKSKEEKKENIIEIQPQVDEIYQKWGIRYCANPRLHYQYPPPTMSVIANIANALASYPKFYVQVLHLMNKLHLPIPFGNVTPAPPIPHDEEPRNLDILQMEDISSQEESELESDDEQRNMKTVGPSLKRPQKQKVKRDWKKLKLNLAEMTKLPTSLPAYSASDVFEANPLQSKKILFKLPEAVPETMEETQVPVKAPAQMDTSEIDINPTGFGKIAPVEKASLSTDESESQQSKSFQFVSADELKQGRISSKEMKELSVYKNYVAGEPSSRLYIKNLSKHVSEEDLWKIFGYYVNWNDKDEKNMFYIRLMQEGRIRGQAFVTLPSEEVASVALEDTNGFLLYHRPMVVQFARSAKQKDENKK